MNLSDDDFALFGLPRRFALDRAELDTRWRALQGQAHPDRFAAQGASAQRVAMQWAVRINEAHQRLKDPLKRAALLCELNGAPLDAERNTAMPRSFLVQQMAWRESLDDADDVAAVQALEDEVAEKESGMLAELARLLDERHDWARAADQVRALMFVARFRADVEERLEALGQ
jgi:molecular chaperone HscB